MPGIEPSDNLPLIPPDFLPVWILEPVRSINPITATLWLLCTTASVVLADAPSAEQLEFFEKEVRPLLVQNCQDCHGGKKQEGGLRLDTHAGFLKGADDGPVFIAGNLNGSKFWQVLQYSESATQMPPKGKLPESQIATFRKWLELGAPWPTEAASSESASSARTHWAFQPVVRPSIPDSTGVATNPNRTPVDSFIAAALSEKGLSLSDLADRYTFIRRLTLDLLGVPPTFEQVQEFQSDNSPDAMERLIDRTLASPLYGQRWGRHWLDIARYADSKGYVFTAEPRYPYSYTYRDYVVDAFNADTPFDRFVIEQLAADSLVGTEQGKSTVNEAHDSRLAALGFLTVGRRYLNNNQDIIDDRIDVVSRGFLGLTVGCARCHDHKFDPIPTADYYSLYGVFSSTTEPEELPIIGAPKSEEAHRAFLEELAKREAAIVDFEKESVPKVMEEMRKIVGDSMQVIARQEACWKEIPAAFDGKNEPRQPLVKRWKDYLQKTGTQPNAVFGVWTRLAKVAKSENFAPEVAKLIESWTNPDEAAKVNSLVRQAIIEQKPATLVDLGKLYGRLFLKIQNDWTEQQKTNTELQRLPDNDAEELRRILFGESSPTQMTLDEARSMFGRDIQDKITGLRRKVDNLRVMSPGAPPRAMVVRDGQIHEPVVFIRGNAGRHGKKVPRQFLEIASVSERKPFTQGSGRKELAESIVDPTNPLTARVIVNRIWQHHFGTGIVATPSDFGTRGMPPSHPQLLDWLAAEASGVGERSKAVAGPNRWSIKQMHRLVLSSATYQQASDENAMARAADPENRLLWHMPRLRLEFESLRDSMLSVAGRLDDSLGGQPFEGVMSPAMNRRTIYAFINRNDLPGIFRAFDFADTDSSAAERPQTTVPQQSLFAMNSPFIQEQSRRLAAECVSSANEDAARVTTLYRRVFARNPTKEERDLAVNFLRNAHASDTEKLSPWERLTQVLLMTNEFTFVD